MSPRAPLKIGQDVPGMLKSDLELERSVITALREAIAVCETARDYQTREIWSSCSRTPRRIMRIGWSSNCG